MSVGYWTALQVLTQVAGELGLTRPASIISATDVQSNQLLALLNSGGNELQTYYPWEQFAKEWNFTTVPDQPGYDVPDDYNYFTDQTQWDRTNHWPLLGPKSPQEWAWLKGSLVAQLPRIRYRVQNNELKLWPVLTGSTPAVNLSMEYISKYWVSVDAGSDPTKTMIDADEDVLHYNPWLLVKFVKFKFYELKGFDTTGTSGDFMRVYNSLIGKDVGGAILSLAPQSIPPMLGPWSVPDGSWNVS